MIMRNALRVLLLLSVVLTYVSPQQTFCSSFCWQTGCTGWTSSDCNNQCITTMGWIASGGPCMLDSTATNPAREQVDCTDDAGGSFYVTPMVYNTSDCPLITSVSYYGGYTANQTVNVTLPGGTTLPHFKLDVVVQLILIDEDGANNWDQSKNFLVAMPDYGLSVPTKMSPNANQDKTLCGANNKWDSFTQVRVSFLHTNLTSDIVFQLSIQGANGGKPLARWVFRELNAVAQLCNIACITCYGSAYNQCWSCDPSVPYMLSGTSCNLTCLTGYGPTDDPAVCVLCNATCTMCYNNATNCSACTFTGGNAAYLYLNSSTWSSCLINCPPGYFKNTTTHVCDMCYPNCTGCILSATHCTSCVISYGWYNYICYLPCNSGFYYTNNNTNCTKCSPYCLQCINSSTNCQICVVNGTYASYYYNNTCVTTCPVGYYGTNYNLAGPSVCIICDPSCAICTGSPSPCTQCNPTFYLYNNACGTTCPTGWIAFNSTWTCINCDISCTSLSMATSFADSTNSALYFDLTFSAAMNWSTFNYASFASVSLNSDQYTLDMFTITIYPMNNFTYRIKLVPTGYIFLYNVTFTVTTMEQTSTVDTAANLLPFKPTNYQMSIKNTWFVIKAPSMGALESSIVNGVAGVNNVFQDATTTPFISDIKKTGFFAFLFSGAHITSATILVNTIPSQNLYEGVRFWAIFVFFDVPPWEQNSKKPNRIVSPDVYDLIKDNRRLQDDSQCNRQLQDYSHVQDEYHESPDSHTPDSPQAHLSRKLFNTDTIGWRFQRTGQTSFFIFDCYAPMILIALCWLSALLGMCCFKEKKWFKTFQGKWWSATHKIHEVAILYISISTMMEWIFFDAASFQRWMSLIICLIFNVYFIGYELYIYHDMIKYPAAQIGNDKYQYFVLRYSTILKNIRYQEYEVQFLNMQVDEPWSPMHWFRPYNYHILSYYKKFLMMISLPIFYETKTAQIAILIIIQLTEIVRFSIVRPYYHKWRLIVRFILEIVLLAFFITVMVQDFLVTRIMRNDPNTLMQDIDSFYKIGWAGFVFVFVFNGTFVVLFIIDVIVGCRQSNRERMDQIRRAYFFQKVKDYQDKHESVPLFLMNKWVKLGNLNQRKNEELPDIHLRVEYFRIKKFNGFYDVDVKKILELFMNVEFNFQRQNNTTVAAKINKKITLTKELSPSFYQIVEQIYKKYCDSTTDFISIKTFTTIIQKEYEAGDRVALLPQKMFQKIEIEDYKGQKKPIKLATPMKGFPLPASLLSSL